MTVYEYLKGLFHESKGCWNCKWRYVGPGYGQGIIHRVAFLEPNEVITCSNSCGYLGTPEDFLKHFEFVQPC